MMRLKPCKCGLQYDVLTQFGVKIDPEELSDLSRVELEENVYEQLARKYEEKENLIGAESIRQAERMLMLNVIDNQWKDHLLSMDHLKEGIGLRGYGQKDPLVEYKKESFLLFQSMMDRIEDETIRYLFFLQGVDYSETRPDSYPFGPEEGGDEEEMVAAATREQRLAAQSSIQDFTRNIQRKKEREMADLQFVGGDGSSSSGKQPVIASKKPGRNDPCSCGSGKKYKKCCGS
jgi:preprotein translocase subunit SecA